VNHHHGNNFYGNQNINQYGGNNVGIRG